MTVVLGVDPGAASLGLVVRRGDQLLAHATLLRQPRWTRAEWVDACLNETEHLGVADLVAVEDVVTPSPHVRRKLIDPTPIIETAMIAGAIAGWSGPLRVVWVPPGGNGSGYLLSYPIELRPTRGQGKGADSLKHERSAFDVAGMGALIARGKVVA